MRAAKHLVMLMLLSSCAFAQGGWYSDKALGRSTGNAVVVVPGATIKVCTDSVCNSPISLYSDQALSNSEGISVIADANGNFGFFAAPGVYFCQVASPGFTTSTTNCQVSPGAAVDKITNQTIAGVKTFTQGILAGTLNGAAVVGAGSQYPCSTAGVQSAIADALAKANGVTQPIVDARPCTSMTITSEIDIGDVAGDPLIFLFPVGTWTVTGMNSPGSCAIKQFGQTSLYGPGNQFEFTLHGGLASNHLSAIYCTTSIGGYLTTQNFQVYNPNGATVDNGAFYVDSGLDDSLWKNINVASYGTVGINIAAACCTAAMENVTSNGNYVAGSIPLVVGPGPVAIELRDMSIDHPGVGLPSIKIQGGQVAFTGVTYVETSDSDTTTVPIQISDATNGSSVSFDYVEIWPQVNSHTAYAISNAGTSALRVAFLKRGGNSSGTNGINEIGYSTTIPVSSQSVLTNYSNNRMTLSGTDKLWLIGPEFRLRDSTQTIDVAMGAGSFGATGLGLGTVSNHPINFYTNGASAGGIDTSQNWTATSSYRSKWVLGNTGTVCSNGELALSAGWGTSPTVTAVAGSGQTCKWTVTAGTGSPTANPTITDTLTNTLPSSVLCRGLVYNPATGTMTGVENTTLSTTAPVFTAYFTPVASTAYRFERTCGP